MLLLHDFDCSQIWRCHIDGLVQDCSNSSALAVESLQSCAKPSIFSMDYITTRVIGESDLMSLKGYLQLIYIAYMEFKHSMAQLNQLSLHVWTVFAKSLHCCVTIKSVSCETSLSPLPKKKCSPHIQTLSNLASDWLAAQPPANQKSC